MSALRNAAQTFRKVWSMGEEDEYEEEDAETHSRRARYEARPAAPMTEPETTSTEAEPAYENVESRTVSRTVYAPTSAARHGRPAPDEDEDPAPRFNIGRGASQQANSGGGGRGGSQGGLRSVAMPLRARDKNIYTLKPKEMDEASLAADYLKTGCAVVINLDEVERMVAVRIIDFMSGVCYGLENQGHAMKLGDFIFLFTPGEFEITSDEIDYGENPDFIFKDVNQKGADDDDETLTADQGAGSGDIAGERRSWER